MILIHLCRICGVVKVQHKPVHRHVIVLRSTIFDQVIRYQVWLNVLIYLLIVKDQMHLYFLSLYIHVKIMWCIYYQLNNIENNNLIMMYNISLKLYIRGLFSLYCIWLVQYRTLLFYTLLYCTSMLRFKIVLYCLAWNCV